MLCASHGRSAAQIGSPPRRLPLWAAAPPRRPPPGGRSAAQPAKHLPGFAHRPISQWQPQRSGECRRLRAAPEGRSSPAEGRPASGDESSVATALDGGVECMGTGMDVTCSVSGDEGEPPSFNAAERVGSLGGAALTS